MIIYILHIKSYSTLKRWKFCLRIFVLDHWAKWWWDSLSRIGFMWLICGVVVKKIETYLLIKFDDILCYRDSIFVNILFFIYSSEFLIQLFALDVKGCFFLPFIHYISENWSYDWLYQKSRFLWSIYLLAGVCLYPYKEPHGTNGRLYLLSLWILPSLGFV